MAVLGGARWWWMCGWAAVCDVELWVGRNGWAGERGEAALARASTLVSTRLARDDGLTRLDPT